MTVILFLLAVLAAGLGGYAVLTRLGLDDFDAWAGGRTVGLVAVAFPAWWAGVIGVSWWRSVAVALLIVTACAGVSSLWRRRGSWREVVRAEAVYVGIALVVLFIRLDHPQIMGQEKPMDMGILATLLRSEGFPPLDMWLAGETLPYYYWGALLWTAPLAVGGLRLEVAYNLIVALVGGAAGVSLWALGRRLAGSHLAGATAAFFGVLAGTPDAWRQIAGGIPLRDLSVWRSSRQHEDVITEFPLFTEWLGDLHPHYLSIPIACAGLLVAWRAGRDGPRLSTTIALAVLFGVAWAANPWCMPPTLAAIALLLLCGDGRWHWPNVEGRGRWLAAIGVAVGGWLAVAPFHLAFHPPFQGVKWVFAWTAPSTLLLYGGCLLIPAFAAAVVELRSEVGFDRSSATALTLAAAAVIVMAGSASGRPSLVLLAAGACVLGWRVVFGGDGDEKPALALTALGLFLLMVPEVIYVVDSYGERLHRMNTVFKAYIQAWILIAVSLPVLLKIGFPGRRLRTVVACLLVIAALPHLVWMGFNQLSGRALSLDGMAWMHPGDRAIVRHLRRQPAGSSLVEAVGGAYTEYARFSAYSGVPAYIGWENHELVWRGHGVTAETSRRAGLVREIYSCGDPARVGALVAQSGAGLVVIGSLERTDFPEESLEAVRRAGAVVLDDDDGVVVRFPEDSAESPIEPGREDEDG